MQAQSFVSLDKSSETSHWSKHICPLWHLKSLKRLGLEKERSKPRGDCNSMHLGWAPIDFALETAHEIVEESLNRFSPCGHTQYYSESYYYQDERRRHQSGIGADVPDTAESYRAGPIFGRADQQVFAMLGEFISRGGNTITRRRMAGNTRLASRRIAARVCSSWNSSVHSQMLPVISMTPNGLAPWERHPPATARGGHMRGPAPGAQPAHHGGCPRDKRGRPGPAPRIATPTRVAVAFRPILRTRERLREKPK